LLHGSGSEREKADDITCRINVRNRRLVVPIHGDVATIVEGQSGLFQCQAVNRSPSARGEKSRLRFENFAAVHGQTHSVLGILSLHGTIVETEMHANEASRSRRRSEISLSRKGRSRSRPSTRVTSTPSAIKMEAYSQPMTPPPITARLLGMRSICRKVSESKVWTSSKAISEGRCGFEPVAMRITSPL